MIYEELKSDFSWNKAVLED